jgi:hypothetical protein
VSARSRAAATVAVLSLTVGGLTAAVTTTAQAVGAAQATLPNAVPAVNTPDVTDGAVQAIAIVGNTTVLGGTFTSIAPHGGVAVSRVKLAAFDATTGALTAFNPTVVGTVTAVAPGPGNTVYVAGLTSANGIAMKIARLDVSTGAVVSGWKPPAFSSAILSMVSRGGRLFVGGNFSKVGGKAIGGIVALDPNTGALQPYVSIGVAERHGGGTKVAPVGVKDIDVDPAGTHLVAIGNFRTVTDASGTYQRDQIFRLNLGATVAAVDTGWDTEAFSSVCQNWAFDSDPRDVEFDPTGSYFVVVAAGGWGTNVDGTRAVCDGAARFETNSSGADVQPTWTAFNGADSLWSVAITGPAVYVGGHQRWMNNPLGNNFAGSGTVPRPGLAALDPVNGLPLAWNPGRNPRGAGTWAFLATNDGLYVGSDTDFIGNRKYTHKKVAFFPLAGGSAPASTANRADPGTVNPDGSVAPAVGDQLTAQHVDASGTAGPALVADASTSWSQTRAAFLVGSTLFYGRSDGTFNKRSFAGGLLGAPVAVDPYNDPVWSNVNTGSGQTYRGLVTDFYAQLPYVTSAFYTSGRVYYTYSGLSQMYYRDFTPDSGIFGAQNVVADGMDWSHVAGAFLSGSRLYFADGTDGVLRSVAWAGDHATGSASTVDSSRNWAAQSLFVRGD